MVKIQNGVEVLLQHGHVDLSRVYKTPEGTLITYQEWVDSCTHFADTHGLTQWRDQIRTARDAHSHGNPWPLYVATLPVMMDLCKNIPREQGVFVVLGPGGNIAEVVCPAMMCPLWDVFGIDNTPTKSTPYERDEVGCTGQSITWLVGDYTRDRERWTKEIRRRSPHGTPIHIIARHPPVDTEPPAFGKSIVQGLAGWADVAVASGGTFTCTTYTMSEMRAIHDGLVSVMPWDGVEEERMPRGACPVLRAGGGEYYMDGFRMTYRVALPGVRTGSVYKA